MKSNVCKLSKDLACIPAVLAEVEKVAAYNGLEGKNALRLRLLAEELCGMLPGLIKNFDGEFWVETAENVYELHVELLADSINASTKKSLIDLSASGENAAAKGIMGKIREVAENLLIQDIPADGINYGWSNGWGGNYGWVCDADPITNMGVSFGVLWSLSQYQTKTEEKKDKDATEELERSIVAKLTDDIIVGVRSNNVEIVVKKTF